MIVGSALKETAAYEERQHENVSLYNTGGKEEIDLFILILEPHIWLLWKLGSWQVPFSYPKLQHKYKDTCRRWRCTGVNLLSVHDAHKFSWGLVHSKPVDSLFPGHKENFVKASCSSCPAVLCTESSLTQLLQCAMPSLVLPAARLLWKSSTGLVQILLTSSPYSQVPWWSCPLTAGLPGSYWHHR